MCRFGLRISDSGRSWRFFLGRLSSCRRVGLSKCVAENFGESSVLAKDLYQAMSVDVCVCVFVYVRNGDVRTHRQYCNELPWM